MKPIVHSTGTVNRTRPPYIGEQPIEDFDARRHPDDHACDAEEGVDVRAGAHGEKMMQPNRVGEHADRHTSEHHRAITKQRLSGKRGDHLGIRAKCRQDQDVDFGMAPGPDEVDEHHHVAAGVIGKEMEAEIAIEREHAQGGGEDRKSGDDEQIGGERGPTENRHAQIAHAGRADLENRRHEVDAGHQRADP